MNRKSLFIATLVLFIASVSFAAAPGAADTYKSKCASCHGPDGKGQTRMGRQSGVKDYTDPKVQAEFTDDKAIKIIKEGIIENGKKKMDPYGEKLSDDETKALVAYIRAFKK